MLISLNSDGERVSGSEATKEGEYYCQQCEQRVIPKKGNINIHHFAHYPGSPSCVWWEPESKTHLRMKDDILKLIKRTYKERVMLIEPEYKIEYDTEWFEHDILGGDGDIQPHFKLALFKDRKLFPDVFTQIAFPNGGKRIAIECQKSKKSAEDVILKTQMYSLMDIYTLWLFDDDWKSSDSDCVLGSVVTPSMVRQLHTLNYGRVYTLNRFGVITAYHLCSVFKTFTPLYPSFNQHPSIPQPHYCEKCGGYSKHVFFLDPEQYNRRICRSCFDGIIDDSGTEFGQSVTDVKPRFCKHYSSHSVVAPYLIFYEINGLKIARFNDRKWW